MDAAQADLSDPSLLNSFRKPVISASPTSPWVTKYAAVATVEYQQRIHSASWLPGAFPGYLALDATTATFTECDVPLKLSGHAVTWYHLSTDWARPLGGDGVVLSGAHRTAPAGTVNEQIKDVHVVELPDGLGWLMVAGRLLYDATLSGPTNASNSISQIVAWWAPTEDFTGDSVMGPFLLVDGARCLADDQEVRLWVGVPTVAVVSDGADDYDLYVFYAIETCGLGSRAGAGSALYDDVSIAAYARAVEALGHEPGVAAKRIALQALRDAAIDELRIPGFHTDEASWTPDSALDGDLLGQPRLWFADPDAESWSAWGVVPYSYTSAVSGVYDAAVVHLADPVATTCASGIAGMSLWLAINVMDRSGAVPGRRWPRPAPRQAALGPGTVPGARAVPGGTRLYDTANDRSIIAVSGVDFVFAPIDATSFRSPDQLGESTATSILLDPDPVRLDYGSWWCMAGGIYGMTQLPTAAWAGAASDGCASWRRAFASSDPRDLWLSWPPSRHLAPGRPIPSRTCTRAPPPPAPAPAWPCDRSLASDSPRAT